MIDLSRQEQERYLSHLLDRDLSRSPTKIFASSVERWSSRSVSRSRRSSREDPNRRRSGERKNAPKSRSQKGVGCHYCLEEIRRRRREEVCEVRSISFDSIIANSLFGLFAVTLTTCFQALFVGIRAQNTVKSRGLTPDVHTPSSSPGVNPVGLPGPVHYVIPMPSAGTPGAPHFEGLNVTDFLERFSDLCEEHGVSTNYKIAKLPRYCDKLIGDFIKSSSAWATGEWEELVVEWRKEYRDGDSDQKIDFGLSGVAKEPDQEGVG